ncbi:hypothetical protein CABS02_13383 [Colletotrichum abscissum]|uniref:Uncharacterized protein n=1 Tax=Colletotrichum abscissum TaxID=1671311 RepID=A0A9Q0AUI1_9PEZI|nr:hypothetical protein CABS02_13383 [Colletotrichum abscissum]
MSEDAIQEGARREVLSTTIQSLVNDPSYNLASFLSVWNREVYKHLKEPALGDKPWLIAWDTSKRFLDMAIERRPDEDWTGCVADLSILRVLRFEPSDPDRSAWPSDQISCLEHFSTLHWRQYELLHGGGGPNANLTESFLEGLKRDMKSLTERDIIRMAIINVMALLEFGNPLNPIVRRYLSPDSFDAKGKDKTYDLGGPLAIHRGTLETLLRQDGAAGLPALSVALTTLRQLPQEMAKVLANDLIPWVIVIDRLNSLDPAKSVVRPEQQGMLRPSLPEDDDLKGLMYLHYGKGRVLDDGCLAGNNGPEQEDQRRQTFDERATRIIRLAQEVADRGSFLLYDAKTFRFSVPSTED